MSHQNPVAETATSGVSTAKEIKGKLTKENMASTVPVDAPVFLEPPYYYEACHWYQFNYETDAELASTIVPAQFTLAENPVASLIFADYPNSSFGPYLELIQGINVKYKGTDMLYMTRLYLDTEPPTMAGREVYGFPKKRADISFTREADILSMRLERPKGTVLCTAVLRDEKVELPLPDGAISKIATLRVIPSPEQGKKHSLVELIATDVVFNSVQIWSGTGSVNYPEFSALDPLTKLPIKKPLGGMHIKFNAKLPHGKIIETL